MTTFYIFRHGNTKNTEGVNSLVKRFVSVGGGSRDLPILPKSRYALEKIGEYLKNIPTDANFTSPYLRCRQSSEIVEEKTGKKFIVDERIRELRDDLKGALKFEKRVKEFLDEIEKKEYKSVAICTHGAVIAAIKHIVREGRFFYFQGIDFPSPGKLMILKDKKVEILNFNKK